MVQPKLPRLLPLTRVSLRDEDGDVITVDDLFDELIAFDVGSYDLERGVILYARMMDADAFAVRTKAGHESPFCVLSVDEAKAWLERMISPITTPHAWRLKVAIHKLHTARRDVERADITLDGLTSHDPSTMAGRLATKKWQAAFEKKIRIAADDLKLCLRAEAHAIWLVRYMLRQRARIRRTRGAQLPLPFPE